MQLRKWDAVVAAVLAGVVVLLAVWLLPSNEESPPGGELPAPEPVLPELTGALLVKIDNVGEAMPQRGLAAADTVYVEPVEGGLTRLAAVFTGELPNVVGPVRSARETDVQLFAGYDRPVFAYSGAAPELAGLLRSSSLVLAGPSQSPGAYFRAAGRPAPHNLFLRPGSLPERKGDSPAWQRGSAPEGGREVATDAVDYPAARYAFRWLPDAGHWSINRNGQAQARAANVIVQRVPVRTGLVRRDGAASTSPVATTVGSGAAVVLRDGKRYPARWERARPVDATRFTTDSGEALPLAPGPVWVLLVPR
ncbi:DUF3048 family protein [Tamaricihabitans halophyticus]|uniref:DUF3048 family protein n=1 Tax=Tamaricihabitans halophyticus TaxID=1262583 RepID=A0A4R2RCM1_9PSEU|nr:DUF3048 domain-containing protein [Tamaricihabitans halophyticus]TCP57175.1 DUF3048 family protein [Tamaricihabitans halophyticus]